MAARPEKEKEQEIGTIEKIKVKRPSRFKVLLHNDDYTTMEFVINILQIVFAKTLAEAQEIMLKIHHQGSGACGIYTHEIAETKAKKVRMMAKSNEFPLKCSIEPE